MFWSLIFLAQTLRISLICVTASFPSKLFACLPYRWYYHGLFQLDIYWSIFSARSRVLRVCTTSHSSIAISNLTTFWLVHRGQSMLTQFTSSVGGFHTSWRTTSFWPFFYYLKTLGWQNIIKTRKQNSIYLIAKERVSAVQPDTWVSTRIWGEVCTFTLCSAYVFVDLR